MKILICKLNIDKEFLNDILDEENSNYKLLLVNMLLESIGKELKKKKRSLSKDKNIMKIICKVKTSKI